MPYPPQDRPIRRVAVQHGQRFYRDGLQLLLDGNPRLEVVGDVADASGLLRVATDRRPDIVVLDGDAQGWDPARLALAVRRRRRRARLVALVEGPDARRAHTLLRRAGVAAVVASTEGADAVFDAVLGDERSIRSCSPGPSPDSYPTAAVEPSPCPSLTRRELQVLSLVSAGYTTKETGVLLAISAKTVESHKQRIFAKLDVQNQAHAVAIAMRNGLLSPAAALDAAAG